MSDEQLTANERQGLLEDAPFAVTEKLLRLYDAALARVAELEAPTPNETIVMPKDFYVRGYAFWEKRYRIAEALLKRCVDFDETEGFSGDEAFVVRTALTDAIDAFLRSSAPADESPSGSDPAGGPRPDR